MAIWAFLLTLELQNGHSVPHPCDRSSSGWHPCHNQSLAGSVLYQPRHVPMYRGTVKLQQQNFWGNDRQLSIHYTVPHSIWIHICVPIGHWNTKPMESVYSIGPYRKWRITIGNLCTWAPHLQKTSAIIVIEETWNCYVITSSKITHNVYFPTVQTSNPTYLVLVSFDLNSIKNSTESVLNLLAINSELGNVAIFMTVDLQTIFYTSYVRMFVIHPRNKFHMPNSDGSLWRIFMKFDSGEFC